MRKTRKWQGNGYDLIIPGALRKDWHDGVVTADQAMFLAEIESLVQHGTNNSKYGCCPSNEKLAEIENCSVRMIEMKLSKLVASGHIIVTKKRGTRYLRTCWSNAIKQAFNRRKATGNSPERKVRVKPKEKFGHNIYKTNNGINPKGLSPVGGHNRRHEQRRLRAEKDWDSFLNNGHKHAKGSTKLLEVTSDEYSPHEEKLAQQLHSTLLGLNRLRSDKRDCSFTKTKSAWAKQIHRLVERYDKRTVTELIRWYCNNARDKYTPIIWSATSLKTKFKQIQAAMKRHETKNPQVKVGKEAKAIVKRLKNFRWPKGSAEQLPVVVQLSLQNYNSFRNGISETKMGSRDKVLAKYVLSHLHRPSEFVYQWFENVFWNRESWDGWDGNLMRDVFTADSDKFVRECKSITGEYCTKPQRWNGVLEKLNADQTV